MTSYEYLAFGDLLRRHRVFAGMSQEELAARAGLSARAISDLERGVKRVPRRDTAQLLVEALQLNGEAQETFVAAARELAARRTAASRSGRLASDRSQSAWWRASSDASVSSSSAAGWAIGPKGGCGSYSIQSWTRRAVRSPLRWATRCSATSIPPEVPAAVTSLPSSTQRRGM